MVWKPKEKELTQEEALALAKKELAPFWIGSPPLLAAFKSKRHSAIYPIDPSFNESSWILFFINPMSYSGKTASLFARELHHRYADHHLKALAVIQPTYSFLNDPKLLEYFNREHQLAFPMVIDSDHLLSETLGVKELPQLIVLQREKVIFRNTIESWLQETEPQIQNFLRSHDPGLALLPFFKPNFPWLKDVHRLKFGRAHEMIFPPPGFGLPEKGFATGVFSVQQQLPSDTLANGFSISGIWLQDAERIATSDSNATLGFTCPTPNMGFIAQSLSKTKEPTKIAVEVKGFPVLDTFSGLDVEYDDEGQSVIRLDHPRLYDVLKTLPPKDREITFRFPTANRSPIALYEIVFGE